MEHVQPIPVGRNAGQPTLQEALAATATAPLVSQAAPEVQVAPAAVAPVAITPVAQAPVAQAPVAQQQVIQQTGGCQMYFKITPVTRINLEMPWGFINQTFDVAFVTNLGELVVSDVPPMYDQANDVFVLEPSAKSIVLGAVSEEFVAYWRESVSFRPDSGYSEEDVKLLEEETQEEVVAEVKEEALIDTTDYTGLSRSQRKKVKRRKLDAGIKLDELPAILRNA